MLRILLIALLLCVMLLGLLIVPTGSSAQSITQVTLYPPGTVIFTLTPSAAPTMTPERGCSAPLSLGVGDEIGIRAGINLRAEPSASSAQVNYFPQPVLAYITDGPVCADGYNWWRVRGVGDPGWVAEGKPYNYYISLLNTAGNMVACAEPQEIQPGERIRILQSVRVRAEPGSEGLVLTIAPFTSLLPVLDGPVCRDGLNYWQVQVEYGTSDQDVAGWIAEGPGYDYYIEPELRPLYAEAECRPPFDFSIGERIVVKGTHGAVRILRGAPSEQAPLVATLIGGLQLTVLDGPVCRDNFNWWQVQVYGGSSDPIGWVAEGTPADRFLEPLPVSDRPL
ncbi:MAG: hypothetical protein IT320_18240 [Anaerolineae bacterium]|nr:hypothetical protein [Anaerolineae bacterium]